MFNLPALWRFYGASTSTGGAEVPLWSGTSSKRARSLFPPPSANSPDKTAAAALTEDWQCHRGKYNEL